MKKYKLIVSGGDSFITGEYENVVKGFAAAEERAKELLDKYLKNYPDDAYVACFEKNEEIDGWDDYLIYKKDCFDDKYWKMMVVGAFGPLYDRLLEDDEKEELKYLRNEVELHVSNLNREELKELRKQVCVDSVFLASFQNSFEIDEEEVCDVCEGYDYYLRTDEDGVPLPESEWMEDTPEAFAEYCLENPVLYD